MRRGKKRFSASNRATNEVIASVMMVSLILAIGTPVYLASMNQNFEWQKVVHTPKAPSPLLIGQVEWSGDEIGVHVINQGASAAIIDRLYIDAIQVLPINAYVIPSGESEVVWAKLPEDITPGQTVEIKVASTRGDIGVIYAQFSGPSQPKKHGSQSKSYGAVSQKSQQQSKPVGIFWWYERVPYDPNEIKQFNVVMLDGCVPDGGPLRSQEELTQKVQEFHGYGKEVWGVVGGPDSSTWITQARRLAIAGCTVIDLDDFWTVWHSQGYDVVTSFGDIYDAVKMIDPSIKICITEGSIPSYIEDFLSALQSAGKPLPDYICPARSSQNSNEDPLTWADWQVSEYRRIQSKFGIEKVFGNVLFADLGWNTGASMDFFRKAVEHTLTNLDGLLVWGVGWGDWDVNWEQAKTTIASTRQVLDIS